MPNAIILISIYNNTCHYFRIVWAQPIWIWNSSHRKLILSKASLCSKLEKAYQINFLYPNLLRCRAKSFSFAGPDKTSRQKSEDLERKTRAKRKLEMYRIGIATSTFRLSNVWRVFEGWGGYLQLMGRKTNSPLCYRICSRCFFQMKLWRAIHHNWLSNKTGIHFCNRTLCAEIDQLKVFANRQDGNETQRIQSDSGTTVTLLCYSFQSRDRFYHGTKKVLTPISSFIRRVGGRYPGFIIFFGCHPNDFGKINPTNILRLLKSIWINNAFKKLGFLRTRSKSNFY